MTFATLIIDSLSTVLFLIAAGWALESLKARHRAHAAGLRTIATLDSLGRSVWSR